MGQPVDKGWAWVCCLGAAVNMFFVVGGLRSVGLLFIEIVEKFNSTRAMTSMTVGFMAAGFAILSPIANALGMKFTVRKVTFIGGICTALSAFLTAFAPNILYIILVFGVWTGVGYGVLFGPSLVVVGMHFRERRSLANGLAAAGGSLGQLVIPQLMTFLLKEYSFQGCLIIYSALILHTLPASMLFRPPSFYLMGKPAAKTDTSTQDTSTKQDSNTKPVVRTKGDPVNNNEVVIKSLDNNSLEREPFIPDPDLELKKDLSKSKQSLYASQSSLFYAPHQDATDDIKEVEKTLMGNKAQSVTENNDNSSVLCKCCSIFEWSLFKNWLFVIYVAGLSCGHGGYINLCMFFPPYAAEQGIDRSKVALLLSIIGISDLIGRILGGWFADLGLLKRSNIMALCLSFTGVCAILVPFIPSFPTLAIFCIIVGMIGGVYVSLMVVVIIDFLGLQKLASSFGLATMCMGLATIPIPVILGVIKDTLGSFSPAVRICGSLMVMGGIFFGLEKFARKLEDKKHSENPIPIKESNV